MSIIDEALNVNATIARDFDPSRGNPPAPKIAIVTCADPRLSSILQMLGLADKDVDVIRNFGTVIDDDAVRSLVLSTRLLGTREIMIINHTDCGMLRFVDSDLEDRLRKETGQAPIAPARFYSFTDAEKNTREQVQKARSHQRVRVRRQDRATERSVCGRGGRGWLIRAPRLGLAAEAPSSNPR
jgi:carbonic anhydrase